MLPPYVELLLMPVPRLMWQIGDESSFVQRRSCSTSVGTLLDYQDLPDYPWSL